MSSNLTVISTPHAPQPAGHYAQAIAHQGTLYVAGQLPIDPTSGAHERGDLEAQLQRTLANLDAILRAAGTSRDRVLRVTIYIADITLWPRVNATYAAFFGPHRPARTVVPTPPLHHGFLVELDAIAALA